MMKNGEGRSGFAGRPKHLWLAEQPLVAMAK